jgi:UDP-glucose 4-epimerase
MRVLVTGGSTPLGMRLAVRLAARDDVEAVWAVDHRPASSPFSGVDTEQIDWRFRDLIELLADHRVDTVVHAAMTASRSGAMGWPRRASVIPTMHLAAAAGQRHSPVRTVVAASSTEAYPASSHSSLLHPESEALHPVPDTVAASIIEAEGYLHELADFRPHLGVGILRLADLSGPGLTSPLGRLLELPLVPVVVGYDPEVQLLHGRDAVAALEHACLQRLTGTYNVAGEGRMAWSDAARLTRRSFMPVPPFALGPLEPVLHRLGVPVGPSRLVEVLRYGRCVATERLRATGFQTRFSTRECVELLRR